MIRNAEGIIRALVGVGAIPFWQWPLRAAGWSDPSMVRILKLLSHFLRVDGCMCGTRDMRTEELTWKPWRIQSTSAEALQWFEGFRCNHNKRQPPISEASSTSYYPRAMAKRFVASLRGTAIVPAEQLVCGLCKDCTMDAHEGMDGQLVPHGVYLRGLPGRLSLALHPRPP